MRAAAELLKGTKKIQPNSKYERSRVRAFKVQYYEKPGTYTTAMKDFFSVDPTDIKEYEIPHKVLVIHFPLHNTCNSLQVGRKTLKN